MSRGRSRKGRPAEPVTRRSGHTEGVSKIVVSVDDWLLARIDRAAKSAGLSRSAYLAGLAARDLGDERGPGSGRQARRALLRLQRLFDAHPLGEEATAALRADRDNR